VSGYSVTYSKAALKSLAKLDSPQRALVLGWIEANLQGCEGPRAYGAGLKGDLSEAWRYRVGSYRIIAELMDEELLVQAFCIDHRKDSKITDERTGK